MDSELNKKIKKRMEELCLYNISNRYIVGYDSLPDGSQQCICFLDRAQNKLRYITNKKWKIKLGLFVAKLFGWQIFTDKKQYLTSKYKYN